MIKIILVLTALGFSLTQNFGCSTASVRVMPGEGGVNKIVSRDIEKAGAEEAAVDAANDFCKDQGKHAVFLDEKTKYTGSMDEKTRETVRMSGKAAQAGGMVAGNMKGNRNNDRKSEIRDLERERDRLSFDLGSFDKTRKEDAQKRASQIDAEIARLRSEQERSGSIEDVAMVGGAAAQAYTSGKDYQNDITFKCQ